jgi:hypothetical protein
MVDIFFPALLRGSLFFGAERINLFGNVNPFPFALFASQQFKHAFFLSLQNVYLFTPV